MKTTRLLLPFTHGVHTLALEYAVMLAKSRNATLVPLSLIAVSNGHGSKGARLEHIQQSKDFLAVVQHKAAKYAVPVEYKEIFTNDVVESINQFAQEMDCEGVLLFVRDRDGVLLHTNEVKHIVTAVPSKHHIIHLSSNQKTSSTPSLLKRVSGFLTGRSKQRVVTRVGLP